MKMFFLIFNFLNIFNFGCNYNFETVVSNNLNANNICAVNEASCVTTYNTDSYLYYEEKEYIIKNCVVTKTLETINNIYLISNSENNSNIVVFNKFNKSLTYKSFDGLFIENIYEINNSIYVIGNEYEDAVIYNLNFELDEDYKRLFNSDGYMSANNLVYDGEFFYITIFKNGITNNSEFINHGNINEFKSILVKLDVEFNVLDVYYFDENSTYEYVKNIYIKDTKIYVLLKLNKSYYIYKLEKDFKTVRYYQINTTDDVELINHHKSVNKELLFNKTKKALFTSTQTEYKEDKKLNVLGKVYDYKVIDGNLYLYSIDNAVNIIKVSEYEIIKESDKILNYFNLNYLDTSNVLVESWFTDISIEIGSISPYFDKTMCGMYEIEYKVLNNNNLITTLYKKLIIDEYTNFINNGIYKEGKVLEFFGTAKLNGETIYYGNRLNNPGEYDIEITNINGEVKSYHLYIVPNYYKEENIKYIEGVTINNDTAFVNIELNNNVVKDVLVDNKSYSNYEIIDDVLVISFPYSEERLSSYMLNGVVFIDREEEYYYELEKQVVFNYLKEVPNIILNKTIEEERFSINLSVSDLDKTFMYLKIVDNNLEQIFSSNQLVSSNNLKVFLCYDLGDGNIFEVLISEVVQDKIFDSNIELIYEDGRLNSINIIHDIKEDSLKVLNVLSGNKSYLEYYEKIKSTSYLKSIIIICISIVSLSGVGFVGYFLIKKSKRKSF